MPVGDTLLFSCRTSRKHHPDDQPGRAEPGCNYRKEYFCNVSLQEVESFIGAKGVTAQFTVVAEAREYRETQAALAAKKESEPEVQDAIPEAADLFSDDVT